MLEDKKEKIVYLKGDKDAQYRAIMEAMDALRKAQIENIALITEKKNQPAAPPAEASNGTTPTSTTAPKRSSRARSRTPAPT